MVYGFRSADPVFEANIRIPLELVCFPADLLDAHGPVAKVAEKVIGRTHFVELFNANNAVSFRRKTVPRTANRDWKAPLRL